MEEKVLISSKHYSLKILLIIFCTIGLITGVIAAASLYSSEIQEITEDIRWINRETERFGDFLPEMVEDSIELTKKIVLRNLSEIAVVVALCFAGMTIVGVILYTAWSRTELVVSDTHVCGKAAFGKRVDLPIDSVSAIGSAWPKGIAVATSSGRIAFPMIKNRDAILKCISDLLIERQNKLLAATTATPIIMESQTSQADELIKFKELLDNGVITREEFDAKKKQLLGL